MEEKLKSLIEYAQSEGRVCPMPILWTELWKTLPDLRQKDTGGWEPPPPLILAAWYDTSANDKRDRLKLHIEYAVKKGVLDKIDKFLRELKLDQWAYGNGTMRYGEWKTKDR